MKKIAKLRLGVAGLLLAECSQLDGATVARLARVDLLSADPASFAFALDLPRNLDLPPGGAVFTFHAERRDTGETLDGRFPLAVARNADAPDLWHVAETDLADLRALQATARAWKQAEPKATSGSISLVLDACAAGPVAAGATVNATVELDGSGTLVPLLTDAKVTDIMRVAKPGGLPGCT